MAKAETLLGFSGRSKPETVPDSESDSDQEENHGGATGTGQAAGSLTRVQVIHSGHFMVSSPHSDSTSRRKRHGVNFDTVNRTGCQTYRFGPRSMGSLSIDPTLTRLFECMTLAYSGKIVSPKWKSFKGLRLLWRDKIRLNNGIWRAWYIQYVEKRKNPVCGFVTPLEGSEADTHRKPEAIVLEGNYWKRRIEVVIKEYHKWRIYHKKRLHKNKDGHLSALAKEDIYRDSVKKWTNQMFQDPVPMEEEEGHLFDLDCFLSDISDTLFTMTQNPCLWQEVRENAYTSNADMIQPGLTPLQPNLDDFMDIPDIFMNHRNPPQGQAGLAECGYLPTMSSSVFSSGPSSVQTGCQLQANAMSDNTGRLPLPSTSDCVSDDGYHGQPLSSEITYDQSSLNSEAKYKAQVHYGHQPEFCSADLRPESDPYGSYRNPPTMTPPNITGINQDCCYAYSAQSHKYRYNSPVTSSVITHTGSMSGPQDLTGSSYPSPGVFPSSVSASLVYPCPSNTQAAQPVLGEHAFSMPRGRSQTTGGQSKEKTSSIKPRRSLSFSAPLQSSCLAKLLSTGKPTLSFDPPFGEMKSILSTSPTSPQPSGNAHLSRGVGMKAALVNLSTPAPAQPSPSHSAATPALPPLHIPSAHCSSASTVLQQSSQSTATALLVPKTEKLTPDKPTFTVSFARNAGQLSPTNTTETIPSPHSPLFTPSQGKAEHTKIDSKRITHISAEQKRRFNIKIGFDTLHSLVTTLSSQPSTKISKATTLQKTAEYIAKMQQERCQMQEEAQRLREEIQELNSDINVCQQQLPETGVPITRQRFDHMRDMFDEYVRGQTLLNWKFWIFSILVRPLFESFNGMVSTASVDDLCRTTLTWLDQYCSLPALRPTVLSSLRHLSTSTSILTDPSLVPEQASQAVSRTSPSNSYS
ncbi:carbohydrate-responsive element-binding protein isoform X2 [Acipenser ruthenus]|uniref:carbohydrate-responsive element-binding protein isoform X2 n=1 Tax=Acipenser ruthenus TaxID=7906 RepID=UPI00145AB961|nr:carbohydrate-responsive element-binding protein isoform X2 [Acipenser ruthenus]